MNTKTALSLFLILTSIISKSAQAAKTDDQELLDLLFQGQSTLSEAASEQEADADPATAAYIPALHFKKLMTKIDSWRKPSAKHPERNTINFCMKKVKTYQCENSEFKDLAFMARYEQISTAVNARLSDPETSRGLEDHKNAMACIMSRETGTLEPITVSYANCTPDGFGSDLGLGQVTMRTFLHVIGLTNPEINKVVNHYFGRSGLKKKKLILSDDRANSLPEVTRVSPFNTLEYRKNPMRMYEEMADSFEFQIDMTMNVLKLKKAFSQDDEYLASIRAKMENPKLTVKQKAALKKKLNNSIAWFQTKTYENYNGSDTKVKYGQSVYACKYCLDKGVKDTAHCLGLAMGTKSLKDFTVCKK
ncbi:MAG: hypothetical protein KA715_07995 [Xanthomonadaceae bacterium]|nr:hypothetical protein [Xanthomonadaceae bacterium]